MDSSQRCWTKLICEPRHWDLMLFRYFNIKCYSKHFMELSLKESKLDWMLPGVLVEVLRKVDGLTGFLYRYLSSWNMQDGKYLDGRIFFRPKKIWKRASCMCQEESNLRIYMPIRGHTAINLNIFHLAYFTNLSIYTKNRKGHLLSTIL